MQSLFKGLDSTLRLSAVALEAFSGGATTALSGFGMALLIGFGAGHGVLLHMGVTILEKQRRPGPLSRSFPYLHTLCAARPQRWRR
jgi:hypothetical protein